MKTIYLKSIPDLDYLHHYYYKIVEIDQEKSETMTVTQESISIERTDEFHGQVSFIKNVLSRDEKCTEIKRDEFDEFYKKTVEKINQLSSL